MGANLQWIVSSSGVVSHASRAVQEQLGSLVGRPCYQAIRATDRQGAPICDAGCAFRLKDIGRASDHADAVVRGRRCRLVCNPVGGPVVVSMTFEPPSVSSALTAREQEVFALVARGLTTAEIARRLKIRPATVRTHVEHVRDKLGCRTRAEVVARLMASQENK